MAENSDPKKNTKDATASDGNSKLEGLLEEIKNAVAEFKTLEIVTVVGSIKPGKSVKDLSFEFGDDTKSILTRIDLLSGDITTVLDEAYVTGDYQGLRDYHAQREDKGYVIIRNNIAAIKELFSVATSFLEQ